MGVCLQDLSNYNKNAVAIAKKYFSVPDIDDYYKKTDPKPLIFCHFARGLGDKVYNEVTEFKALYKTLMEVSVCPDLDAFCCGAVFHIDQPADTFDSDQCSQTSKAILGQQSSL